jgi:hypothetical protein
MKILAFFLKINGFLQKCISLKLEKKENYQIFTNICKPNIAYLTSILKKMAQNYCKKTCANKLF